jgi:hypothetical protein
MPRDVLAGGPDSENDYRTHITYTHYEQILAMSQPTEGACVHVFDGNWPRYSFDENERMRLIGQTSKIQNVLPPGSTPIRPPVLQFGTEPVHGWCYIYQKAELALQLGDDQQVSTLGDEAQAKNLQPADPVEWMPFVQAYAALGDQAKLALAAEKINKVLPLKVQACSTLKTMQGLGTALSSQAVDLFCK